MELVIAVILVIILFVKINSDKEAKRSACERFDEKQRKISEWKARVTDRNLERQLKAFIQNPENKETAFGEIRIFLICFLKTVGAGAKMIGHWSITNRFSVNYAK